MKPQQLIMRRIGIFLFFLVTLSESFNIDFEKAKSVKGDQGTEFGFSLQFFKLPSSDDINLMVSAPKGSSTTTATDGGSLRYCYDVLADGTMDCSETSTQSRVKPLAGNEGGYKGEGYGSALSVSDDVALICAPRYKDVRYAKKHNFTFMPGRCEIRSLSEPANREDFAFYTITQNYFRDTESYLGLASLGFSSDAAEDQVFAIGVPGLAMFTGGIYLRDYNSNETSQTYNGTFKNTLNTTASGFEGYAVKFGKFCDGDICLAAGAPNRYLSGRVIMYKWPNKESLEQIQILEGENNWSYFGSALCATNVDADSYDELLIGAPMFTDANDKTDIGKVYVYKRNADSQEYELEFDLVESHQSNSRFGSAIETIGSINLDTFQDVIIGAPGDENGQGCVYIYLGSSLGLSRTYDQKICASQIPDIVDKLQGFGSAFTRPVYPKSSRYPVFAVGSPLSDTATLFNCRPIVDTSAILETVPKQMPMPSSGDNKDVSTQVKLCINFTIHDSNAAKQRLDFAVDFEIDKQVAKEGEKRAAFVKGDENLKYHLTHYITGLEDNVSCITSLALIIKNKFFKSRFTPIEVVATYRLNETSSRNKGFTQNMGIENKKSLVFEFTNDCGIDNVCRVNLEVQGQLVLNHAAEWPHIVVGHTSELTAKIKIKNAGETSYWTEIQIHIDQYFPFLRFTSKDISHCEPYQPNSASKEINVVCNYYQPLNKDSPIDLVIVFDTETVSLEKKNVLVSVNAMPMYTKNNPEIAMKDNAVQLSLPVFIVANVKTEGVSFPSEIPISKVKTISLTADEDVDMSSIKWESDSDGLVLNHKLLIQNEGPSFLPPTKIALSVPIFSPDATQLVTSLTLELSSNKEQTISCFTSGKSDKERKSTTPQPITEITAKKTVSTSSVSTVSTTEEVVTETTTSLFNGGVHRKKRSAEKEEEKSSTTYTLSCKDQPKYCQKYLCELPNALLKGGHTEVNITLTVDGNNIPMPKGYSTFVLRLDASVIQPTHLLFKDWNTEQEKEAQCHTTTMFHRVAKGETINLWIIIGSVIGGLVLIFIIAIILWKCGFFKREKHYQVEKWKRQSQRISQGQGNADDPQADGIGVDG